MLAWLLDLLLADYAFTIKQQGMAHLLEHVAYMGSPKRQLISGTGKLVVTLFAIER